MLDSEQFRKGVKLIYDQLMTLTVAAIGFADIPRESVAYALLKMAAFIATKTGCPREIFVQLAGNAFDEETILGTLDEATIKAVEISTPDEKLN